MTAEFWTSVQQAFHAAIAADDPDVFLASALLSDEVRAKVSQLLASHDKAHSFLDQGVSKSFISELEGDLLPDLARGSTWQEYRILEKLGGGQAARVYLAEQTLLSRLVALKFSTLRLANEGRTLAELEHPNIVQVYDESWDETSKLSVTSMQYVPGVDLSQLLQRLRHAPTLSGASLVGILDELTKAKRQSIDDDAIKLRSQLVRDDYSTAILRIMLQAAQALAKAHSCHVVHLDVKPANILIDGFGRIKLADFNISMASLEERRTLVGGTWDYASPEQRQLLSGETATIDVGSDLYSFGLVLREMLVPDVGAREQLASDERSLLESLLAEERSQRLPSAERLVREIRHILQRRQVCAKLPELWAIFRFANRHPKFCMVMALFLPQLTGSVVNISYNALEIVRLLSVEQQVAFTNLLLPYNLFMYSVCVYVAVLWFRPILRFVDVEHPTSAMLAKIQPRIVGTAWFVVAVTSFGWLPGAVFFPGGISVMISPLSFTVYLHFAISFVISWLIALCYSLLLVEAQLIRLHLVRLWNPEVGFGAVGPDLRRLLARVPSRWVLAGCVPLAAASVLLLTQSSAALASPWYRGLLGYLIFLGAFGFILAVRLSQYMRDTLLPLIVVAEGD